MHLENNCQIIDSQHGFSKGKSCFNEFISFSGEGSGYSWWSEDPVDVLYLDFKKAFDKVLMSDLWRKLKHV